MKAELVLLRDVYAAFNSRDIDRALATMQPDVTWPNGMEGGWVYGRDEVRAYWTRQWETLDPSVEPLGFHSEADGRIAVTVHRVVRDRAGALLVDDEIEHAYRFRAGLIAEMEIRERADPRREPEAR